MFTFTDPRRIDLRTISMDDLVDTWIDDAVSRAATSGCTCGCGGSSAYPDDASEALWLHLLKRKAEMDRGYTNVARKKTYR